MQKLLILKGLPASGKTTKARKWVEEDPKNRVRISRDCIRRMLGPYWIPQRESLVTELEVNIIENAINQNYSVIWDNTNFRIVKEAIQQKFPEVDVIEVFIDTSLNECIKRNAKRKGTEKVPEETIKRMYNKYLK